MTKVIIPPFAQSRFTHSPLIYGGGIRRGDGGGGGGDFPVVAGTNTGGTTGFTFAQNFAVPLPASISAGDELLIMAAIQNSSAVTPTTPTGWTELFNVVGGGNMRRFVGYTRTADGGEGGTVTINTGTSDSAWATCSYRFTGVSSFEVATATGSSATPDPPNLAPSGGSAKILWLANEGHASASGVSTPSNPTDYTDQITHVHDFFSNEVSRITSARRELEASSEDPGTFGIVASAQWVAATIAVIP